MRKRKVYVGGVYYEQDKIDKKFFNQVLEVVPNRRPSIRVYSSRSHLDNYCLDGSERKGRDEREYNRMDESIRYYKEEIEVKKYPCYFDMYNLDGSKKE